MTTALGMWLQTSERVWRSLEYQQLRSRGLTVLFAYVVLAWNRFGLISFSTPRAPMQLILVGVYGWLGMAALIWLASQLLSDWKIDFHRAAVATAIAHVPLVFLAFFMAIVAGFARLTGPSAVVALLVAGLWMPALLTRGFHDGGGLRLKPALAAAVVTQLIWTATVGRYLVDQVGHLL